jgi:site-specific DNA-methyltransferase (adenine-specific)
LAYAHWAIVFGGNYYALPPTSCWLVWDKLNGETDFADCELAWTSFDKNTKIFKHVRNTSDVRIHICQKPVALYKWLLKNYAKEGDKILDTHGGSMSIAIAAFDMGFDLDLCELDPDYYAAGVARFESHRMKYSPAQECPVTADGQGKLF